jgi:hypothetical protein
MMDESQAIPTTEEDRRGSSPFAHYRKRTTAFDINWTRRGSIHIDDASTIISDALRRILHVTGGEFPIVRGLYDGAVHYRESLWGCHGLFGIINAEEPRTNGDIFFSRRRVDKRYIWRAPKLPISTNGSRNTANPSCN